MKAFCESLIKFKRRESSVVLIGEVPVGGGNPVAVQSMTNTSTLDTASSAEQIIKIREKGCRIVRLTTPGKPEAQNLGNILTTLKQKGHEDIYLVADIHFTPDVALVAAEYAHKVRINPGNYRNDKGQFKRLIEVCKQNGVSLRIGVNHGSLAKHIVEKWGDTPRGMVESAMEFLYECREEGFDQVVVSMKSSNVRVMVHAYRLLSAKLRDERMSYPFHLGVTEAGDGAEGRIKSAVGIGSLLSDGIGDTIRVSLTEPPENEVPVAGSIIDHISSIDPAAPIEAIKDEHLYYPFEYNRRNSDAVGRIGGANAPVLYSELTAQEREAVEKGEIAVVEAVTGNPAAEWRSKILNMTAAGDHRPVILHRKYHETDLRALQIKAAVDFGMAFIDGLADGIWIENRSDQHIIEAQEIDQTALIILQAARVRMSQTEYIACPGCGRTLFDLQTTLAGIRERTSHLRHLKIGVMGCIVNGPGEMADADYGYVGAGPGRVTLYKNKEVIKRNVPQDEAIEALIEVIKNNGDWTEPEMGRR